MKTPDQLLKEANEIIRSFGAVCDRRGAATNWDALNMQVRSILSEQHQHMHSEQYVSPRAG